MTTLNTLPLAGLQPILAYLDLTSLTRLFSTFDLRLQRLLTSPNVTDCQVIAFAGDVPKGALRYFLRSIRNVRRLLFNNAVNSEDPTLPLLMTLNPVELGFRGGLYHPSPSQSLQSRPEAQESVAVSEYFTKTDFPKLSLLTPRLTQLIVDCTSLSSFFNLSIAEAELSFPSTLTSIQTSVSDSVLPTFLGALPRTMHSITLTRESIVAAKLPFDSFPHLQTLTLECSFLKNPSFELPQSLRSLTLLCQLTYPYASLQKSKTFRFLPQLSDLRIENVWGYPLPVANLDLCQILPSSVISLHLDLLTKKFDDISFPSNISYLHLDHHGCNANVPIIFKTLSLFPKLTHFGLLASMSLDDVDPKLPSSTIASSLPRSLTSLEMTKSLNSKQVLCQMPTSLTELTLGSFEFDHLQLSDISSHLPNCRLHVKKEICIWNSGELLIQDEDVRKAWFGDGSAGAAIDLPVFRRALHAYFQKHKLDVKLDASSFSRAPIPHACEKFIGDSDGFDCDDYIIHNIIGADVLNHQLTTLVIDDLQIEVELLGNLRSLTHFDAGRAFHINGAFPWPSFPRLSFFSCESTQDSRPDHLPESLQLRHFHAPLWSFTACSILANNWKDMTAFNIQIISMADYNIIDFLTKSVNAKTRSNMHVDITYFASGCLLSDTHKYVDLTYEGICSETAAALQTKLGEPMPVPLSFGFGSTKPTTPSKTASSSTASIENDTIGRVVGTLTTCSNQWNSVIYLPKSTISADISLPYDWSLHSNLLKARPLLGYETRPQPGQSPLWFKSLPLPTFSSSLVRLSLLHVNTSEEWLHLLPPTLSFLRLLLWKSLSKVGTVFPKNLATLVLESEDSLALPQSIPFKLDSLPKTLENLAIISASMIFPLEASSSEETSIEFPHLNRVIISGVRPYSAPVLVQRLPLATIQSFTIQYDNVAEAWTSSLDESAFKESASDGLKQRVKDFLLPKEMKYDLASILNAEIRELALDVPASPSTAVTSPTAAFSSSFASFSSVKNVTSPTGSSTTTTTRRAVRPPRK